MHAKFECKIFVEHKVFPPIIPALYDGDAVLALRCLMLMDIKPSDYQQLMALESVVDHVTRNKQSLEADERVARFLLHNCRFQESKGITFPAMMNFLKLIDYCSIWLPERWALMGDKQYSYVRYEAKIYLHTSLFLAKREYIYGLQKILIIALNMSSPRKYWWLRSATPTAIGHFDTLRTLGNVQFVWRLASLFRLDNIWPFASVVYPSTEHPSPNDMKMLDSTCNVAVAGARIQQKVDHFSLGWNVIHVMTLRMVISSRETPKIFMVHGAATTPIAPTSLRVWKSWERWIAYTRKS